VQVVLDYNESVFELQGARVLKLGDMQPTIARTVKFTLKPTACIHIEKIEASIIYRDSTQEKHMAAMQAKEVHCICPFLNPKPVSKEDFLKLSGKWHTLDTGMNFEGITAQQLIAFLMQTCARNLYAVDGYTSHEANVLHFSSESADRNTHYLLTAMIKENDGLTQAMFRAVSDRNSGLNGFLNEIISELRHLVSTLNSASEIGVIKNELVTNIIDTVVPRSKLATGNSESSTERKKGVMQKSRSNDLEEEKQNFRKPEDVDVARMYDSYLKQVKSKPNTKRTVDTEPDISDNSDTSYPRELFTSEREIRSVHNTSSAGREKSSEKKPKKSKKKIIRQALMITFVFLIAMLVIQNTGLKEKIAGDYATSSAESAENVVLILFTAVNEGDFTTAFKLCEGQDFLVPASIQMIFNNNGIEAGGIKETNIVSTVVADDIAVIESNCTAVTFNIMGNENEPEIIDVYFQLQKSGSSWVITGIVFDQPYDIRAEENDIAAGKQG
jgi:glycine betaine/proline transport system substrate-binding protein